MDNPRQQRGLVIAATAKLQQHGQDWLVPSQTGNGRRYRVCAKDGHEFCTCPDHEETGKPCKHIFAVQFVMQRELFPDGTEVVTQSVTVTETIERPTYRQDWPAYNAAQRNEKTRFQELLAELCKGIPEPVQGKGRPRLSLRDSVFAAVFKVFSTVSGRRFSCDLEDAKTKGYIDDAPHYNSIFRCLESKDLTPILHRLITQSSLPLRQVECDFACDSSGFSTSRFVRWFDQKYGVVKTKHDWVKCHIMCGVKTNIVTAVVIGEKHAADALMMPDLVAATAEHFALNEVSADKGYSSKVNMEVCNAYGAAPFIAFKRTSRAGNKGMWTKMFHYFSYQREEFLQHYHKRSNVESTFSMIKAKFRDHIRSKSDVAMMNEVLCKILCHNLCVLIQEIHELGIEPTFWVDCPKYPKVASKVAANMAL